MKSETISTEHIINADSYVDNDRVITPEDVDKALSKICKNRFSALENFSEKMKKTYERFVVSVFLDVMLKEMGKKYYDNVGNVRQIVDINNHLVYEDGKPIYRHVENLSIWWNGFYQFNSFNVTYASMSKPKQKKISSSSN